MKSKFVPSTKNKDCGRMKTKVIKAKLVVFALFLGGWFSYNPAQGQVSVNVNIGSQAVWGPVGYDYVDYYYLPEADVFYYVPTAEFIYWSGPKQVTATFLPATFNVNLYSTYKVIVNEPKPYLQHDIYIVKYAKYKKGGPKQNIIRDSRDEKYYAVKGHPKHGNGNVKNNNSNNKSSGNKANQSVKTGGKAKSSNKPAHSGKSKGGHKK